MKEKQYNLDIPFFFLEQPLTWRRQCSTNICKVKSAAFHSESKHCSCGASQLSCSGEGGPDERSEPIGTNLWKTKSRQIFILTVLCTSNTSDHREYLSCCPDVRVFCAALGSHSLIVVSVKCFKSYISYRRKKQQQTNRTEISSTNWLKGSIRAIENYTLFHLHSILYTPLKQNQTR